MYDLIPLHDLAPGEKAQVGKLTGHPEHVQRLEELGLRQGSTVEMVRSGSPCIIRLSGCKLCFRQCDKFRVLVRPGEVA